MSSLSPVATQSATSKQNATVSNSAWDGSSTLIKVWVREVWVREGGKIFAVMSCAGVQMPVDMRTGNCSTLSLGRGSCVELCYLTSTIHHVGSLSNGEQQLDKALTELRGQDVGWGS